MKKFEHSIKKAGEDSAYSLSSSERAKMSHVVREYMAHKPLSHAATYSVSLSYSWFSLAHRPIAVALVFVMIFGSGVSYAAENALPGDTLYTIKTYINEPTRVALAANAEAKAEIQIELAERRIEEAAVLAAEGRLDEGTEDELALAFESHAAAVAAQMIEADKDDDSSSIELASRFETRLAAHENVLLEVESEDDGPHSSRLADAIRSATEETISASLGSALAADVTADSTAEAQMEAEFDTAPQAPTMAFSLAGTVVAPEPDARTAKMTTTATAPAPDAKKISRMKSAAEKSLKNAQKKFKNAKSLSLEAQEQAAADFALATSLIAEGDAHIAADENAEAFASFKESLRVTEQASVYMKAAPTLEKARSRARNIRAAVEDRIESRTETSEDSDDSDASITVKLPIGKPDHETEEEIESHETESDEAHIDTDVKIKLDLSL